MKITRFSAMSLSLMEVSLRLCVLVTSAGSWVFLEVAASTGKNKILVRYGMGRIRLWLKSCPLPIC